jgi:N-acetylneuraminic acid mutarotase
VDIISNNYAYNPSTDSWTKIAPMPTPRVSFAIASYNNKIYVIGGLEATSNGSSQVSSSVNEVYDPSTDTWITATSIPIATSGAQANTVNGKIYVIGGSAGDVDLNYPKLNITQIFDPTTDSWSMGASMPYPVAYPVASAASAVMDNNIYVIGGSNTHFTQIYDVAKNAWSLGSATPTFETDEGAGATTGVNASKRVYVFGGVEGFMFWANQTNAYNPASNSWMTEEPMPDALMFPTVAIVNDVFYVFGIGIQDYGSVVVEQYAPIGYGTPDPSYMLEHAPPEISLLSPLNQTYNDSSVPLVFSVNKLLAWASYSLDGQQNITITGNDTLTNMANGLHYVTVYANDSFGNIGVAESSNFTVALTPLKNSQTFPTVPVAAVSVAVALVVAGLLVYHKKTQRRDKA